MIDLNNSAVYDYRFARPVGQKEWERVVDSDSPMDLDGSISGPPDVFKLEFSNWCSYIEFKKWDTEG